MRTIQVLMLLCFGTLLHEVSGQNCKEAFQEMLGEAELFEEAEGYVNALKAECSESIMESMRAEALSSVPDDVLNEKSAPIPEAGVTSKNFMCKLTYDEFTDVTTLSFDGSHSGTTTELYEAFRTACQAKPGRKFCSLSFSGGSMEGPDVGIDVLLDYENLATCIPAECDHDQNDVETLNQQFLGESGFFGFQTGIDISDVGRMPIMTCESGLGEGGNSDTTTQEASALQGAPSTSDGFSFLKESQGFTIISLNLVTIVVTLVALFP